MTEYPKCLIKRLIDGDAEIPDEECVEEHCYKCDGFDRNCGIYQSQMEQWYAFSRRGEESAGD